MNISNINTVKQHMTVTLNSPRSLYAATIPTINEINPASGLIVESIIAGKVITDNVTYGT